VFDRTIGLIGEDSLNKIKSKRVLVLGLGGVGGSALETLVRSGVEDLIIIDFDSVDVSNINRQVISFNDTIGRKKIDVATEFVRRINPECRVISYDIFLNEENISDILDANFIDYIIDACDSIKTKQHLIKEALKRKIKIISSMGTGNKLDPAKLSIIDIRKTNNDPIARIMRKWVKENKINDKIMVVSSSELPEKKDKVYSMSFVPNVAGILLAQYVISDIIKK